MPVSLTYPAAGQNHGQRVGGMAVGIGHAGSINKQRVIQNRPVAIGCARKLFQKFGVNADVLRVDLNHLSHLFRVVQMMGHGMMLLSNADLRVGALAELARHHEREHPSDVRLISRGR